MAHLNPFWYQLIPMKEINKLFSNAKEFFQELGIKEVEIRWLEGESVGKDMRVPWKTTDLDKVPEKVDPETLELIDYISVTIQHGLPEDAPELSIYVPRKEVSIDNNLDYVLLLKAGKAAEKYGFILTDGDRIEYMNAEASEDCEKCRRKSCWPHGKLKLCEFYNDVTPYAPTSEN